MNKIVVHKAIRRSMLGYLILCGLLGSSGTIHATAQPPDNTLASYDYTLRTSPHDVPPIIQKAYLNSDNVHKASSAAPLPLDQLLIPANGQCLYTTVIMGYLLPVRQESARLTTRIVQLFGCPPAYYLNKLHQTLENPTHYLTYLHSDAFSTLVTVFMARVRIKKGTWGGPQEIQTIATKLNVNIQAHYPDPSNPTNLVQSELTQPAQATAAITIHIIQDKIHPDEVVTQTEKASAQDNLHYQHYRLKYTLPSSIPVPMLPSQHPSIPHPMGSPQKNAIQPYLVEWFEAAKTGNIKLLEELYSNYHINVNINSTKGDIALICSAYKGYLDCVKFLVQHGADINTRDKHECTALLLSAQEGHVDCVKYLIQQGADINAKNETGYTALLLSACSGQLDCIKYLLQQGADVNTTAKHGDTALHCSAYEGHLDCVKFLVQQGANVTLRGQQDKTALQWAKEKGQKDVVNYLSTFAKKEQPDKEALQKWFEIAKTGNSQSLSTLYHNYNLNVNTSNAYRDTALLWSANNGHIDGLKYLVQQGARIHDKNKNGNTALLLSAYNGHLDCVKWLTQQGASIHDTNENGDTALLLSAYNGHLDCVKFLVQQNANLTLRGQQNKTALQWAAARGQQEVVNYLSTLAKKKQPDKEAVLQKWFEVAKTGNRKLLEKLYHNYNINVNTRSTKGNTALLLSAYNGHLDCLKFLIQQGTCIHNQDEHGNTALLLSAYSGHLDCLKYLIQQGAGIHAANENGNTALLWSAWEGHLDCVKFLIQQGANIQDKNRRGSTALQWAKEANKRDVVNYLSSLFGNKDNVMDIN